MNKAMHWMICAILATSFLGSCTIQEVVSDTVEFGTYNALQKAQKSNGARLNAKQQAKETEKLRQEGKSWRRHRE
jgi:aspartate 1-decarboxylase